MSEESVSRWIQKLAHGDTRAETEIWQRYFQRLVSMARRYLGSMPRREFDEEDIALSALNSFFLAAKDGRFPRLADRDDLWKLLLVIAARKATAQRRRHFAARRLDRHLTSRVMTSDKQFCLEATWGHEPTPEFAAECADQLRQRLQELPDDTCRKIAVWRLEGFTNREIAQLLGTYEVKVERKLRLIRKCWSAEADVN